jgi:hypothetical protein
LDFHDVGVVEVARAGFAGGEDLDLGAGEGEDGPREANADLYWRDESSIGDVKPCGGSVTG